MTATGDLPPDPPLPGLPARLPRFEVRIPIPTLEEWARGNAGIPGVMHFESARPGPHVVITALMHGNELAGAIVLDELLREGLRPQRGRLTFAFLNLDAFRRFDVAHPTGSRFIDEDMNRLWDRDVLQGPRESRELARVREVLPVIENADILFDLHSMLWPSEPLILSGPTRKGRALARAIGVPPMAVSDRGHSSGPRLIDFNGFAEEGDRRVACLIEAGPHWEPPTVTMTRAGVGALLRHAGLADLPQDESPPEACAAWRSAEVTEVVTAVTGNFTFVRPFRGGDVVRDCHTLIARDGGREIRTPHDDCLLVMPSLRPSRGHTAVRLARFLPEPE